MTKNHFKIQSNLACRFKKMSFSGSNGPSLATSINMVHFCLLRHNSDPQSLLLLNDKIRRAVLILPGKFHPPVLTVHQLNHKGHRSHSLADKTYKGNSVVPVQKLNLPGEFNEVS